MINIFKHLLFLALVFSPLSSMGSGFPSLEVWRANHYEIDGMTVDGFFDFRRNQLDCRKAYAELRAEFFQARAELKEAQRQFLNENDPNKKRKLKETLLATEKKFNSLLNSFYRKMDLGSERSLREISEAIVAIQPEKKLEVPKDPNEINNMVKEFQAAYKRLDIFSGDVLGEAFDPCGDCTVPRVELKQYTEGLQPKFVYESHGFCSIRHLEKSQVLEGLKKASAFLRSPSEYTSRFEHVLEFLPFDGRNYLPNFSGAQKEDSFNAFMAVRGAKILGMPVVYGYFIKNIISHPVVDGVETFDMSFSATNHNGLRPPKIYDIDVTGKKKRATPSLLKEIIGWWQIDPKRGLIRYSTAAEFGIGLEHLKPVARRIHLDTISTIMHDFFVTEENTNK